MQPPSIHDPGSAAAARPLPRAPTRTARRWTVVPRGRIGINTLLVLTALYLAATQNLAFWHQVLRAIPRPLEGADYRLLGCLFVAINTLFLLVMVPFAGRRSVKPALVALLLLASICSFFMDGFGLVIDRSMLMNLLQTNTREASEWLGLPLLGHLALTGLLPAVLVARVELDSATPWTELLRRCALVVAALALLLFVCLWSYKDLSLWGRANRQVRMYVNPTYPIYAAGRQLKAMFEGSPGAVVPIATDARRLPAASGRPRVVVMVVGETARAANFQLAGYSRPTNPELSGIPGVHSFRQMWSCGTSTAISVPCMFSRLGRSHFSRSRARREENLLDVLQRTGVAVLWRDNNSDCKGVCARVPTQDVRKLKIDGLCDASGCYDEVLLHGLDELLAGTTSDRFIVLHLLGSHGPSYYRRYPAAYRRFTPDCAQDDVHSCERSAIVNAYDNTLVYTDHVLAELIRLLRRHQDAVEPAMLYLSDHGESLGESNLYLHGLPYAFAPDEQKRVPFVVWAPQLRQDCIQARLDRPWSHDDLFHTVLGLFSIRTTEYRARADALLDCR